MSAKPAPGSFDPYDLWMTTLGVYAKKHFYQGHIKGKLLSVFIGLADWLAPHLSRRLFGAKKRSYPITVAQWILSLETIDEPEQLLKLLMSTASSRTEEYGYCWGLGFPWMSKNGLYDEDMPFVTHTPYALEALIRLHKQNTDPQCSELALKFFTQSRQFLDGLKIMYEDEFSLALSYAPIDEPRIVVNANSYACFAYALHAKYSEFKLEQALARTELLLTWVLSQQQSNGSWYYYADSEPGNFIDGFHTCFVLKNLIKTAQLIPELEPRVLPAVSKGMEYLHSAFIDRNAGLLRRFTERDIKDPFVWDLYDQAEYLGLLILLGKLNEAKAMLGKIYQHFYKKGHWYCRKDFFGRHWGKDFLRWGIMPLLHQEHEFKRALQKDDH